MKRSIAPGDWSHSLRPRLKASSPGAIAKQVSEGIAGSSEDRVVSWSLFPVKFNRPLHSGLFGRRQRHPVQKQVMQDWRDLLGILLLSFGLLSFGSLAISSASYQLLKATEPNVEQVSSPLAWDF